jgi:uncharacterized protein (UPF0332 family)
MADYKKEVAAQLERAETSLQAAEDLLEKEYYDIAASRAYYAAFYASSALLLSTEIDPSKHSGVIASIHREFVKAGKLDKERGRNLNWLFELRSVGDYGVIVHVSVGEAMRAVRAAEEYIQSSNY